MAALTAGMPIIPRRAAGTAAHHFAPWQRPGLYIAGAVLLLSGLAWLALHDLVGAGAGELPHPLEAWLMRLHGLAASCGLFMLGSVAASHVGAGWRASRRLGLARQRQTGLLICALGAATALSGYALYYFAPEWLRPALGWAHAAAGTAMSATIAVHRQAARHRAAPARAREDGPR